LEKGVKSADAFLLSHDGFALDTDWVCYMQAISVSQAQFTQKPVYDAAMHPGGRPTDKPRTALGERLQAARERAGISQKELAERLGTNQQRIAYWERSAIGFRDGDLLTKLTDILGVSADELFGVNAAKSKATAAKPNGRARQMFEAVSKLPRRQQEKIFDILQPFVTQQTAGKA
jgi:transcriptional regulator with XRE-family HTH domain